MRRLTPIALLALTSCTETVRLAVDPLDNLVAIDITPTEPTVKITDLAPPNHTLQFTAMGRFSDGTTRDITTLADWKIDNGRLGEFGTTLRDAGLFVASHEAAGYGNVTIGARGLEATTQLTVIIDATIIDAAFPPPAANLFDSSIPFVTGDVLRSPALTYPADDTLLPENIVSTLYQWQRGTGNDAYRIVFDTEVLHLAVETGSDRWQADGQVQKLLAATASIAPIRAEVHARSSTEAPPIIYVGNNITVDFSPESPGGAIFFWSAATNGIMRGDIVKESSSKLYPTSTTCVGCHTSSRDGTQLAMGYDATTSTDLLTINTDSLMPIVPASATRPMGWGTYSPDGTKLLVANNGVLKLYNAQNGASLGTVPLPAMRYATHPDWSPDGTYVAVALTNLVPTNMDVRTASVARIPYNDGAWGTPEILVSGSMTANNYFPRYSPDGAFLAFVRATGPSQAALSAELMLVESGGGMARRLRLASHRVGTRDDVPDLASSMPSWALPGLSSTPGGRAWLAFVSARPYGVVLPTAGRGQIWITSLDLSSTGDPSTPAFWLPCQDATVLNNNPVWSKAGEPVF